MIFAAPLALYLGIGLAMVQPSIGNPFFWDDLGWIRRYSLSSLASTWVGTTDPAHLQFPGFRPLQALSNFAYYALFGESANADRYASVVAVALALWLVALAFTRLGVPLFAAVGGGLLALLSKNLTYEYVLASWGYSAFQLAAFGGVLFTAVHGLQAERRGRSWLATSVALWVVTLLLKDQGILLLPPLIGIALVAGAGGFTGIAARIGDKSSLIGGIRAAAAVAWRGATKRYVYLVSALGAADLIARTVLVPQAAPSGLSPKTLVLAIVMAVSFAGHEDHRVAAIYCAFAVVLVLILAGTARSRRIGDVRIGALWLTAVWTGVAVLITSLYGLQEARADLVYFPLLFYGMFVATVVLLAWRIMEGRSRARIALATAASLLAGISIVASVRASVGVQGAMGTWSVQTLAYDYAAVYGPERFRAPIPAIRRARIVADLSRVGINGPLPVRTVPGSSRDRDDAGFAYLYCRARADPSFPARIPAVFAWGRKALPAVACAGGLVVHMDGSIDHTAL